jgi:hypothetical protein
MNRDLKKRQATAYGLLLSKFGEVFNTMEFEPERKEDGSIVWSEDASVEPDWDERMPGWWDILHSLEPRFNDLGFTLEIQEDAEFFGGMLTPVSDW